MNSSAVAHIQLLSIPMVRVAATQRSAHHLSRCLDAPQSRPAFHRRPLPPRCGLPRQTPPAGSTHPAAPAQQRLSHKPFRMKALLKPFHINPSISAEAKRSEDTRRLAAARRPRPEHVNRAAPQSPLSSALPSPSPAGSPHAPPRHIQIAPRPQALRPPPKLRQARRKTRHLPL